MREYHEIMMRPVLYPGGRVHRQPERRQATTRTYRSAAQPRRRRLSGYAFASGIVLGCVLAMVI